MRTAVLSVLVIGLAVTVGFPLAARASVHSLYLNDVSVSSPDDDSTDGTTEDTSSAYTLAPAGEDQGYDVDSFPIFDRESPTATAFPTDLPKAASIDQWRSYFEAISEPLGISDLPDTIIGWYEHLAPDEDSTDVSASPNVFEGDDFRGFHDDEVDGQITATWPNIADLSDEEQDNLNNLAAGLLLQSAYDSGKYNPDSYLVSAAYTLWQQLLDTSVACQASSNLYAVAKIAGAELRTENEQWEQESAALRERVSASCEDTRNIDYFDATGSYKSMLQTMSPANDLVAPWQEFVDQHPDSATGYASLAQAQLSQARFSFGFAKTSLYEQALSNANKARSMASIPEAAMTATRALILLEQEQPAQDALAQVSQEITPESGLQVSLAEAFTSVGDIEQAQAILNQAPAPSVPLAVTFTDSVDDTNDFDLLGIPQTTQGMKQILLRPHAVFAGAGGFGGGAVGFNSLFPTYSVSAFTERFDLGAPLKLRMLQGDIDSSLAQWDPSTYHAATPTYVSNLLRKYGHADQAHAWVEQQLSSGSSSGSRSDLLNEKAELAYLEGDYATSISALQEILSTYEPDEMFGAVNLDTGCVYQAKLTAAIAASGDSDEAIRAADSALTLCDDPRRTLNPLVSALTRQQMGDVYLDLEDLEQAAVSYREGLALLDSFEASLPTILDDQPRGLALLDSMTQDTLFLAQAPALRASLSNNLAVIMLKQGTDPAQALTLAQTAHDADPASSIYQETYAWALQENGQTEEALPEYEDVTQKDATTFGALNNTALLKYTNGDKDEALKLLRQAVTANPDYALGWSNLSILLAERGGIMSTLQSQGAWAQAVSRDPSLRGATEELRPDREVYDTGLDVSKAVPTDWTFASHSQPRSPAPGIAAMILSVLTGLGIALRNSQFAPWIASFLVNNRVSTWLRQHLGGRGTGVRTVLSSPVFAVAATSILVVRFSWGGGPTNVMILALALVLVAFLALTPLLARQMAEPGRRLAAEPAQETPSTADMATPDQSDAPEKPSRVPSGTLTAPAAGRHFTWWPFMLVAAVLSPTGMVMTPVPLLNDPEDRHRRLRTVGFLTVYVVAVIMIIVAAATNVPLARTLAVAALLMISSLLLTIKPIDGAFLTPKKLCLILAVVDFLAGLGVALNYL
ncbi:tetratricopeptide repeat protein [Actinomyces urogenitalis]|uniref:tetratricopeptide repeat protein n=1 Tax=Actinomyces urogenitalis TaxID=103621 RepID=UPI00242D5035|nr:tetratricopeptide repeat protein [Actinomyces urogenitalis]MCI7457303.1 tetratricopeptide repeat protein [Actinomyces urogenitalis]